MNETISLPPILPVGTQVVTLIAVLSPKGRTAHPSGAVGVIVRAPVDASGHRVGW